MTLIDQHAPPYKREVVASGAWGQIVRITLKPGDTTPPHKHSLPVIGVVIKGHPFELSEHDGYWNLNPHDTFERPPTVVHMVGNPSDAKEDAIIEANYPIGRLEMEMLPGFFDTPPAELSLAPEA